MSFILTSPEFKDGDLLDVSYQADKENQSPALNWTEPPAGTKSFAVAMHDPDAPTGGAGWWHWFAVGIPASFRGLERNAGKVGGGNLPDGVRQLPNDCSDLGYMGCYPPVGDPPHRYIFTVYALDCEMPEIPENATTGMTGFVIHSHVLGKAQLTARYQRT